MNEHRYHVLQPTAGLKQKNTKQKVNEIECNYGNCAKLVKRYGKMILHRVLRN